MKQIPVPIMRPFKHPELQKVKLPDGVATSKELEEMVQNTNKLILLGLHAPGYRLTHNGREDRSSSRGKALGWIDRLAFEDSKVVGYSEFTESGKELIRKKEVRWVSSGIRRDFKLTGEPEGPVLPGLYLDHVAVLGDENPAVKGLVDLAHVELSEGVSIRPGSESFSVNEEDGEVCYFAEINAIRKEIEMEDNKGTVTTAQFNELSSKLDGVISLNKELTTKVEALTKENEELKSAGETAKFSEYATDVKVKVQDVQKKAKFGAELSEKLITVGEQAFGDEKRMKAFEALLKAFEAQAASKVATLSERLGDEPRKDDEAMFAEDGSDLSEKDLNLGVTNLAVAAEINRIISNRQKTDPKFNYTKLREEVVGRSRRR